MYRKKAIIISIILLISILFTGCIEGIGNDTGNIESTQASAEYIHAGDLEDGKRWFDAKVIDVSTGSLTVMPLGEGFEASAALDAGLIVHVQADVKSGDHVRITYNGLIAESYPPQIFNVYFVELIETEDFIVQTEPTTDFGLEFELTENVGGYDFSSHSQVYGIFGGYQYLGSGYSTSTDTEGQQILPEYYVLYTVTAYPDYADGGSYITAIEITDPSIEIFGFSVDGTITDFEKAFGNYYNIVRATDTYCIAECGDFTYSFMIDENGKGKLRIYAEVTNRDGIVF